MSVRGAGDHDWTGWIVAGGALLFAAALLAWTVLPHGTVTPPPTPLASSPDRHIVATDQATFRFSSEDGAIVVRRLDPSPLELGRVVLPEAMRPVASGDPISGSGLWILVCPSASGGDPLRMILGHDDADTGQYSGPPAVGQIAEDGLWLFVLKPGAIDPGARILVTTTKGSGGAQGSSFDLPMLAGIQQPSGCWVSP